MTDLTFDCMGTDVRLLLDDPAPARAFLERFDAALSRFRPASELCRLNADPRPEVPASPLLRAAVATGIAAAERTGGLVDPTLVPQLEANGYDRTRRAPELPLKTALDAAPQRTPARPDPAARWRSVTVTESTVRRPPGVKLDTGGVGKGLAADLLAPRLGAGRWALDLGGDLRVNGAFDVEVLHPHTKQPIHTLHLLDDAVATSGIDTRLWRAPDGTPRHHLLDPSTGAPAWTGLVSVTALAPTASEAETRAKAALLSGPHRALAWLEPHGGLLVTDDGDVHLV